MRHGDFRGSRRREFDAHTDHLQPRALGTRPRFIQPRFEAPSGPPVNGVVKWFSPEKGFGFVELSDGSGDAFLHGSVLAQTGIDAVQQGETLEVRVGPGHRGPHITEVLSVDPSTAAATTPRRSNYRAAASSRPTSRRPDRRYETDTSSRSRGLKEPRYWGITQMEMRRDLRRPFPAPFF